MATIYAWDAILEIAQTGDVLKTALAIKEYGLTLESFYENGYALHSVGWLAFKTLLKVGIDPNIPDKAGHYALCRALEQNQRGMTVLLLEHGARVDVKNAYGETPLIIAAGYQGYSVMKAILDRGVDVNARDNEQSTALHHACKHCNVEGIKALLAYGADTLVYDKINMLPYDVLHVLCADSPERRECMTLLNMPSYHNQ